MIRRWWFGFAVMMGAFSVLAGGLEATRRVEASALVTGKVLIAADGGVSGYTLDRANKLEPAVTGLISQALSSWRFEPLPDHAAEQVDMTLRLVAKNLEGGGISVRIAGANFQRQHRENEVVRGKVLTPPRYPVPAFINGVVGAVYVVVRVGRDGKVLDAAVEQVNLNVLGSDSDMEAWRKVFAESTLAAATKWRFTPPTEGDQVEADSWTVRVPAQFKLEGHGYGKWQGYVPGPRSVIPWLHDEGSDSVSHDALTEGVYPVGECRRLLTSLAQG